MSRRRDARDMARAGGFGAAGVLIALAIVGAAFLLRPGAGPDVAVPETPAATVSSISPARAPFMATPPDGASASPCPAGRSRQKAKANVRPTAMVVNKPVSRIAKASHHAPASRDALTR